MVCPYVGHTIDIVIECILEKARELGLYQDYCLLLNKQTL